MIYTVVLYREAVGGYAVQVPALKGCWTQGETVPEALAMAKDAIEGYLDSLAQDGIAPPPDVKGNVTIRGWNLAVEGAVYRVDVGDVASVA